MSQNELGAKKLKALGLQERTDNMCQLPTYITQVAHGTEKVRYNES